MDLRGKLVILTANLEHWYKELNKDFNVPIQNRLGKISKVLDWETDEGKIILEERKKLGEKWKNLNSLDFKYVVKIYYPELILKDTNKVFTYEVMPHYYPGTERPMFIVVPDWMEKDILKTVKDSFKVEKKEQL